jgi:hypothetical protein
LPGELLPVATPDVLDVEADAAAKPAGLVASGFAVTAGHPPKTITALSTAESTARKSDTSVISMGRLTDILVKGK